MQQMTKIKVFFLLAGIIFGFVLIQSGVSNYDIIMDMFLFREFRMYGILAIAVSISFLFVQSANYFKIKSILTKKPIEAIKNKPGMNHIVGGVLSGFGWALTGACPGPALAQLGFGTLAGAFTVAGIFLGVYVYGKSQSDK